MLWDEQKLHPGQTITQVWFAGMHSNVGGGYADDALSYVSLNWIMAEAEKAGDPLAFKPRERDDIRDKADPYGKLYDSRQGLGGTYRYAPRRIKDLTHDTADPNDPVVIPCPKIQESVFERIKQGVDGYAPIGLPDQYAVLRADGSILDVEEDNPACLECSEQAKGRWEHQEKRVWNLVWWRRVVYFISVFVAVALAPFPLYRPATSACEGPYCFLSPVISGIGKLLPDFVSPWLNAYQSHPGSFSLLVLLLAVLLYIGGRLQTHIFDEMHAIWKPICEQPGGVCKVAGLPEDWLYRLRSSSGYRWFVKVMKRNVLPLLAGLTALLVAMAAISHGLFAIMSSAGWVCTEAQGNRVFATNRLCWASGALMEEGKRYQITLTITQPWKDGSITPGINGFGVESMTWPMYPGLLLRRHLSEPWFKPIARIGAQGRDEYPLDLNSDSERW